MAGGDAGPGGRAAGGGVRRGARNVHTLVSQIRRPARIDDYAGGSGLVGLTDRVEALGGRLSPHSPPARAQTLQVVIALTAPSAPGRPAADTGPGRGVDSE